MSILGSLPAVRVVLDRAGVLLPPFRICQVEDIISDIKETAPIGNSNEHLKDSFTILKEGTKVNKSVTIYSKSKGRLVHLIEFGFVHRNGRFVSARPFLRPSYEKEAPKMEEKIKEAIKNAANKT